MSFFKKFAKEEIFEDIGEKEKSKTDFDMLSCLYKIINNVPVEDVRLALNELYVEFEYSKINLEISNKLKFLKLNLINI